MYYLRTNQRIDVGNKINNKPVTSSHTVPLTFLLVQEVVRGGLRGGVRRGVRQPTHGRHRRGVPRIRARPALAVEEPELVVHGALAHDFLILAGQVT